MSLVSEPESGAELAVSGRPRWRRVVGSFWFQLAAAFVVFGLILSFVAKPYWVPSGSMEETLQPGDRILVNRLSYVGSAPTNGDIVVFDADAAWDTEGSPAPSDPLRAALRWVGEVSGFGPSSAHTLVKRVIAGPGQTVSCCDAEGRVLVDGEPLDEDYVWNDFAFEAGGLDCASSPGSQRCFDEVTVPAGSYLMLGDNRAASSDSALQCRGAGAEPDCWRWATASGIVGKAVAVVWPIGRWAGL